MKRYLVIILLILIFLGLSGSALAFPTMVEDYPKLPACENDPDGCRPGEEGFDLPQFIKYIFTFALGIVGITGFIAIIAAAFLLITSTGNPQKAADAKDRIMSALLGLLLLLGSYILLNIINPDLLKLRMPEAKPISVEINSPTPESQECRFTKVFWDKKSINAGESSTLIFRYNSECSGTKVKIDQSGLYLTQAGGAAEWFRNHRCTEPWTIDQANLTFSTICTFEKSQVLNIKKNQPETFVLEGHLKLNGVKQELATDLYLEVRDLKNDGACCK